MLVLVFVFIFSGLIGYWAITKVPSLLHTPLMSGTNAISGVTVLGALIAAAAVTTSSKSLAMLAIVLAMVNVVGGFLVTDRMLAMFKKGKGKGKE